MGVDDVVVDPVALLGRQALEVELADRDDRVPPLAVDGVAVDVERVGEVVEDRICCSLLEGRRLTIAGSSSRMLAVMSASARSWAAVGLGACRVGLRASMPSMPYAVRVASMFLPMYGASLSASVGLTWNCCTIAG